MKWITDKPTTPGWYWIKDKDGFTNVVWVNGEYLICVAVVKPTNSIDCEWAGPIPEPED